MTGRQTFVIVGASLAGAKAAETLRLEGFDGRIVLIGEEAERPYERPPLSKGYLRGEEAPESIFVHDESFYDERDVELRLSTRVTVLDPNGAQIGTEAGDRIAYDRLLLATGAAPRRLDVPGSDLERIHHLRTVRDADALRDAFASTSRLAVVGAGWIGCEVAASARQLGVDVTLIGRTATPLEHVLGPEVGAVYRDLHADHGVALRLGTQVEAFVGDEIVEGVRTAVGDVAADLVVVGVGAEPRIQLAAEAGLVLDHGIVVDEHLQTSAEGIFAAGDVAAAWHPALGRRLRVEHWANALHQGAVAAKNMLGVATAYDRIPYFFSDQYDLSMEYAGHTTTWDQVVFRGNPQGGEFLAFWLDHGRVVAGMNANVSDANGSIQALIRARRIIPTADLADRDASLDAMLDAT